MTSLPLDFDNNPIQALALRDGGAKTLSATAASARSSAFAGDTQIVSVYATGPVYLKFGDSSVTATSSDHYFPAGVYYDFSLGGGKTGRKTHLAALRADQDCAVYISEKM